MEVEYIGEGKARFVSAEEKQIDVRMSDAREAYDKAMEEFAALGAEMNRASEEEKVPYHWANQFTHLANQAKNARARLVMGFESDSDSYYY